MLRSERATITCMQSVQVVEVAPRDGLQNERAILPTEAKLELVTALAATEDLLYLLHRSGVQAGMSLPALEPATNLLAGALGTPVPGLLSRAGPFPG
jgi:isopropylmalate/homocitrate/citramalate synthase